MLSGTVTVTAGGHVATTDVPSYEPYDGAVMADVDLYEELSEALAASRRGAATRPVSVTLPAPLADAFKLLAEHGHEDNVSAATVEALTGRLQSIVIGLRLDQIYEEFPDARPAEEEIQEMAARAGVRLSE